MNYIDLAYYHSGFPLYLSPADFSILLPFLQTVLFLPYLYSVMEIRHMGFFYCHSLQLNGFCQLRINQSISPNIFLTKKFSIITHLYIFPSDLITFSLLWFCLNILKYYYIINNHCIHTDSSDFSNSYWKYLGDIYAVYIFHTYIECLR